MTAAKRVLVVDDDPDIRRFLAELLEDEGYEVDVAIDGLAALELLGGQKKEPDAILLDFTMPRCGGEEFARRYRERGSAPAPIILLTASHQVAERCRLVNADGCVGKPFDIDRLLTTLEGRTHTHALAA
ncbi:MAG TPA: response regulator [Chloroflexota bacterium]|nr:response regulator [Chloroflexota bacterium]